MTHPLLVASCLAAALNLADPPAGASAFAGTWKGRLDDKPAVDLRIAAAGGGTLSGTALFYVLGPASASPTPPMDLRDVSLKGGVLRFGVRRREDGGITRFEMRLLGADEADLKTRISSLDPDHAPEGGVDPILRLTRER